MTLLALAGIAVVGILSVTAYQWWTNRTTEDDDIEVRISTTSSSSIAYIGHCSKIGVAPVSFGRWFGRETCVASPSTNSTCSSCTRFVLGENQIRPRCVFFALNHAPLQYDTEQDGAWGLPSTPNNPFIMCIHPTHTHRSWAKNLHHQIMMQNRDLVVVVGFILCEIEFHRMSSPF